MLIVNIFLFLYTSNIVIIEHERVYIILKYTHMIGEKTLRTTLNDIF